MDEVRLYVCLGCLYLWYMHHAFSHSTIHVTERRVEGRRKQHRIGVPQEGSFGELGQAVSRVTRLFRMVVKQRARVPGWRRHYFPIPLLFQLSAFFLFLLFPSIPVRVLPQKKATTQNNTMFARQVAKNSSSLARGFASSARSNKKVAVLGAAGTSLSLTYM